MITIQELCKPDTDAVINNQALDWLHFVETLIPYIDQYDKQYNREMTQDQKQIWDSVTTTALNQGSAIWVCLAGQWLLPTAASTIDSDSIIDALHYMIISLNEKLWQHEENQAEEGLVQISGIMLTLMKQWLSARRDYISDEAIKKADTVIMWLTDMNCLGIQHLKQCEPCVDVCIQTSCHLNELIQSIGSDAWKKELPRMLRDITMELEQKGKLC